MSLISQLKRHEGYRQHPYQCTANKTTIAIGRNLDDVGISEQEAEYLLANDIKKAADALYRAFPFTRLMDAVRRDVLINMVFNMGIGGLKEFKQTMRYVELANYGPASVEMLDSAWARQVGNRALELSAQMRTGVES